MAPGEDYVHAYRNRDAINNLIDTGGGSSALRTGTYG